MLFIMKVKKNVEEIDEIEACYNKCWGCIIVQNVEEIDEIGLLQQMLSICIIVQNAEVIDEIGLLQEMLSMYHSADILCDIWL